MLYFVPTLIHQTEWTKLRENITVDDIVLVVDQNQPRGKWRMAIVVVETYPNSEGHVRTLKLKTFDKKHKKFFLFVRPISKVCLLITASELVLHSNF